LNRHQSSKQKEKTNMDKSPVISMIVAVDENFAIGKSNGMLWHLPDDFKHFKKTTYGHPIIMGRKTLESFGKPLPGRTNIIITRNPDYDTEGVEIVNNLEQALKLAKTIDNEEIFIIGGGQIYELGMQLTHRLYLTVVHHRFEDTDAYFPKVNYDEWNIYHKEEHAVDEKHKYPFTFLFLNRK
jgi:dihydrofolate reductase